MNSTHSTTVTKSRAPLLFSSGILLLIVGAYFLIPEVQDFLNMAWKVLTSGNNDRIKSWVDDFGWFGPLLIILCMVAQMFLLIIPSVALMVVAILAYGPFWGSMIVLLSIFTASSTGYWIGRYFGPVIVQKLIGRKSEQKIANFLEDYGFWAIIVTRLNPFLSNDAISFVGGILKMGYWRFIAATLVGIAPLTIFIAIIGKSTDALKNGLLWGSLVSFIFFVIYVIWDKKRK